MNTGSEAYQQMIKEHPAINLWAQKKFNLPEGTEVTVEMESRLGGYCETCSYTYECVVVSDAKTGKEYAELQTSLSEMLTEILSFTQR